MARASREVWAKRVERWQDSGLSAKEFAAELDVSPKSLAFWKWKLRQEWASSGERNAGHSKRASAAACAASPKFVELVPAPATSPSDAALELVFKDGLSLRVTPGFDEPTLMRLVALLGGGA